MAIWCLILVLRTFYNETHDWVPVKGFQALITTRDTFSGSSLQFWAVWKSLALRFVVAKCVDKLC